MSDLTGQLISNTYKQVILVSSSTSNTGVNTSLKAVQTGDGTNTALKVATNAVQITGALGVTGNVSLDANLHVDDKVCASAFYGDGSNLSGVTASVGGNISVSNATVGGNLYVGGTATVAGATHLQSTVSVGGAAQFGSTVTVSGAAQLQSTVTAVGAATFKSTVTVENAAILKNNVSVGGTFAAAGAATFTSKTEFNNDVSVSGRFDVASSVCVGGIAKFASDVSVSGNLNVVNNVTAAFFYGDGSNLTNVKAELGIATNISVSGFIHAGGSVSVSGPFNVVGAATFKSNVSVSGNSNFTGTVTVGGAVSLASSLSVGGAANFASTVTVAGAVSLASTLSVGGATNLGSTVTVVGAGTFKDAVSVSGNLNIGGTVTVGGAVSLASSLSVGGAANFANTVTVAGAVSLASTLSVGGAANFASTVTIAGTNLQATNAQVCASAYYGDGSNLTNISGAAISGNISVNNATVGGNLYIGGTVTAVGAAIFNSTVTVSGNATFKTNVSVSGNTNLGGTVTVAGAASLASTLSVGGAANFASTVTIAGAASVGGTFNVGGAFTSPGIDDNATSTALTISSADNVGIGTTSPAGKLHASRNYVTPTGGVDGNLDIISSNTSGSSGIGIFAGNTSFSFIHLGDTDDANVGQLTYSHSENSLRFVVNAGEKMRIDSSGNVGIGTTSPAEKLEVTGNLMLDATDADIKIKSGGAGTTGAVRWTFNTDSTSYGDISLPYDTRASVGLLLRSASSYPITIDSGNGVIFKEDSTTETMRIDSSGNVGISTTSSVGSNSTGEGFWFAATEAARFSRASNVALIVNRITTTGDNIALRYDGSTKSALGFDGTSAYINAFSGTPLAFKYAGSTKMIIDTSGNVGIGNSAPAGPLEVMDVDVNGSSGEKGFLVASNGRIDTSTDNGTAMQMNDSSASAGTHNYIVFRYQGTTIGDIDTTDNTTIRYNTFTGAHWSQFTDHSQPEIPLGTVMSTINEMCNYTQFQYVDDQGQTQKVDIAGSFEIGSTHTIYIDEDGAQAEGTAIAQSTHKRLAKAKVSDTAGDKSVYGVFAGHYKDGDSSVESLGLGAIRIGSGVTVANGDLLESAGDGTARPQTGDNADLFKASTIAKVTSTNVIETYDDGSYTVPCTLHCG